MTTLRKPKNYVWHIQLLKGPKVAACGKRRRDIRKVHGETMVHIPRHLDNLPRLFSGDTWCKACLDSPELQWRILLGTDL